jgi:hypothetical protein
MDRKIKLPWLIATLVFISLVGASGIGTAQKPGQVPGACKAVKCKLTCPADQTCSADGTQCLPIDIDGDKIPVTCDNCPTVYNPDQADLNKNGIGDACETCRGCLGLCADAARTCALNAFQEPDPSKRLAKLTACAVAAGECAKGCQPFCKTHDDDK